MTCFDQLGELFELDWLNFQDRQKSLIDRSIERGNALATASRRAIEEISRLAEQQSNKVRLARTDDERKRAILRNNELNTLLTELHMAILQAGQILPPEPKPTPAPHSATSIPVQDDEEESGAVSPLMNNEKPNPQSNVF